MYITIRPSLEKVKAWHKVKDAEALYNSLIANRAIDPADLDIYKVTCGASELQEKNNYELIENDTKIEFSVFRISEKIESIDSEWWAHSADLRQVLYNASELSDIEFNLAEPDETNWRALPLFPLDFRVEEITSEVIQTICIEKLNPFT